MALLRASYRMAYVLPVRSYRNPFRSGRVPESRLDQLAAGVCCPNNGRPPRFVQTTLGVEREIINNLTVEVSFIDNRGVWLIQTG